MNASIIDMQCLKSFYIGQSMRESLILKDLWLLQVQKFNKI